MGDLGRGRSGKVQRSEVAGMVLGCGRPRFFRSPVRRNGAGRALSEVVSIGQSLGAADPKDDS